MMQNGSQAMEDWQLDFEWLRVRHFVKDSMNRKELPNMNAILFLVGIQELGFTKQTYTKEEKQDLMHIAVCELLSQDGYYEFAGRDADGWPHYTTARSFQLKGVKEQERLLKEKLIQYFQPQLGNDSAEG
ncbi:MAG: hypothetical protein AAFV95_06435 [Bacteroidota bacterium]